jgi:dipeptidyl aminopeptidase/acylaminoacyl peptidase
MKRLFVVFALIGSQFVHAADAPIPVEQFTRYDEFGQLQISPSGEHVAYLTGRYGRSMVAIVSLKEKKMTGGVRCPEGFEIFDFTWASPSRVVYRIAERQPGRVAPTPTGELLAINADGSNQKLLYGYRAGQRQTGTLMKVRESSYATPEIISPLKNNDDEILIAEHQWRDDGSVWRPDVDARPVITLLHLNTGNKRRAGTAPLGSAEILVDRDDKVRFAVGLDAQSQLAVSWKPDPDGPWTDFALPDFRRETVKPRVFGQDNQSVLFTGLRSGEAVEALYNLDLKTRAVTKVHGFADTDVAGLIFDFAGERIVGVVGNADKPEVHWIDANDTAAKIYRALYRAFPGQTVRIVSATSDGRFAIALASSDVNPGDYFLFDTTTMKADYLRSARSWFVPERMRPMEPFAIKARDGLGLRGYLTRPEGTGPHPLVVLPHGGPHGVRDTWSFDSEVQLLASRGYAVLQVNFRGSGGFGLGFEQAGHREWGRKMQDDITDATRWAIETKAADPQKICIYGASYGAYAALMGVVREPELYRCAIGNAGVYDLELTMNSADIPLSRSGRSFLATALGTDAADLKARSPVNHADKIEVPVLLIHGKKDWRADFEQAERMKAALERNNKTFEWLPLKAEGHGIYEEETRREVYERMLAFLDKHLKH